LAPRMPNQNWKTTIKNPRSENLKILKLEFSVEEWEETVKKESSLRVEGEFKKFRN
jgi:hypothetical protein